MNSQQTIFIETLKTIKTNQNITPALKGNITFGGKEIKMLLSDNWINDEIINGYMVIIKFIKGIIKLTIPELLHILDISFSTSDFQHWIPRSEKMYYWKKRKYKNGYISKR